MARSRSTRNVLTLLGGTTFALAIPLLISPALSRLYTPEQFGQFAFYLSLVAIGAIVATGRFELAILMPRRDQAAFQLMLVALVLSLGLSLACAALLAIADLAGWPVNDINGWMHTVPLGVLLVSTIQCLSYWNTRRETYRTIAASRALQATAMSGAQLAAGVAGLTTIGLISGQLLGAVTALWQFLRSTLGELCQRWRRASFSRGLALAWRHKELPKYMIVGHLANVTSSQMPILLLGTLYGPKLAGFYALADKVLVVPCAVIGNSIGEVYRQEAAKQYQQHGNCRDLFLRTAKKLALLGAVPAVGALALAGYAFPVVFGEDWAPAGSIATVLGVLVFFQTLSSPMSQTILLASMHRADLVWQIARLAVSIATIYAGYHLSGEPQLSITLYVAGFAALYLAHSVLQYRAASGGVRR
jgi:O-antigen/teichoic acid export membrane protein